MAGPIKPDVAGAGIVAPEAAPSARAAPSLLAYLDDAAMDPASWPPVEDFISTTTYAVPSPGGPVTYEDRYWTRRGLEAWLAACPKEVVYLPLDPLNDGDDPEKARPFVLYYDGHPIAIRKGRAVAVPAPIAGIIREGQRPYRTAQVQGIDTYTIHVGTDPGLPAGRYLGTTDELVR